MDRRRRYLGLDVLARSRLTLLTDATTGTDPAALTAPEQALSA